MQGYHIARIESEDDIQKVWNLLKDCFWSKNIPIVHVNRFVKFSLCLGVYHHNELVGFGRVITDYTTYAYICDVVIDEAHRRKGLASALIEYMLSHPDLQGLKTWSLKTTNEAKQIYQKNGFRIASQPEMQLEIDDLEIYCK